MSPEPADIERFRAGLGRWLGLRFEDDRLPWLGELLQARLQATGARGAGEYLERMPSSPRESGELARALSVSETYFLRNSAQFRALEILLRERASRPGARRLRLLSAGCATGEEPYSLAIVLRETLPDLAAWDLSILACDLNPDSLEKARQGRYSTWSLRETPEAIQRRYFRMQGKDFLLVPSILQMVRFEERNLAQPDPLFWRPGAFDVIFCRNMLMYLTPEAMRAAVERFAHSLVEGGFLFLGSAENLRGLSNEFHLCHAHDTFYYERAAGHEARRKPSIQEETPQPWPAIPAIPASAVEDGAWVEAIADSARRIEQLTEEATPPPPPDFVTDSPNFIMEPAPAVDRHGLAMGLLEQEKFQEALSLLADGPDVLLLRAALLINAGDPASAERLCGELLENEELNAGAHYILSLCRDHAGDQERAMHHARIAVYLDPDFAMPHLQLGLLAKRGGDRALARREFELARMCFAKEDAARILLFGGGFGRSALLQLCQSHLQSCGGDS